MDNKRTFLNIIKMGLILSFRKNKTKKEQKAAKSFKKSFLTLFFIMLTWTMVFTFVVVAFYPSRGFNGVKRYGVVENDSVRYQQRGDKYLPLRLLGLDKKNLKDGDSVLIFFQSNDGNLRNAITKSDYQKITGLRFAVIIATAIAGIGVLATYTTSTKNNAGKEFFEYLDNLK